MRTSCILIGVCITLLFRLQPPEIGAATIYVGLGGQNGILTNNGALGTLNPATGAVTVIAKLSGCYSDQRFDVYLERKSLGIYVQRWWYVSTAILPPGPPF